MRVRNKYPLHADVVADVEQFVKLEAVVSDRVFLYVDLQPLPLLLQMTESGLAHQPNRDVSAQPRARRPVDSPVARPFFRNTPPESAEWCA